MKEVENTLENFGITPDYNEPADKKLVYRFVIRRQEKLKKLLEYFIPCNSSKYIQLKLHLNGLEKFGTLNEVIEKLDTTYPRFGKSLTFSDIINDVSDGRPFNVNMLTQRLSKSQDVIKKSLNKLEKWEVLLSNNSKGKINKVWYINPNLKTNGGDKI